MSVTGVVFDSVKSKNLSAARLYLFGAKSTFYGIYYTVGPLDSTTSDGNGRFSFQFEADGSSVAYGIQLGVLEYGGYVYSPQTRYVIDNTQPLYTFKYSRNINDAVVRGRELNVTQLHLEVGENPFDSLVIRTAADRSSMLVVGRSLDTTIYLRHLPGDVNTLYYFTESVRDTVGYIPGQSRRRMLTDTLLANMADTFVVRKVIPNIAEIPRQ